MTRYVRRTIFYFFVFVFIVAAPLTIMYAMGYSYDWQKNAIVQTGGLYLKSEPSNAQIMINGKTKGTTNRLISRLAPRTWSVQISKNGFYSWNKNLDVLPKIVTEARNVFLFPQKIGPELIATTSTSTLEDFLKTDQEKLIENQARQIASSTAGWLLKNSEIYFISESNFELYRETLDGSNQLQLSKESLTPEKYQLFSNDNHFFLSLAQSGELYILNIDDGLWQIIASGINGAVISDDNKKIIYWSSNEIWIYYLQDIKIQPYKNAGDRELITRFAQKISQAIFYPNNEYTAFVVGNQIKITELDGRDQRNTIDFVQTSNPQIYFDQQNNIFYYQTQDKIFKIILE